MADERPSARVQAIVDTGADVTAIPAHLQESLRLYPFSRLQMEDARGHQEPVYTYEARITVADHDAVIMEVILLPFPFAVLGRDWLVDYYLLLNGPEQRFLVSGRPIVTEAE
ncbi:MAG: retropepsin-like aspartic protease [Anaerolineae bacterium]|nr:retropepsin-like aspartic protease [Anaerolineae bacterium]